MAVLTTVIAVMFVAIVLLVSALCVCCRLHKHQTQATLTNDTLYNELNMPDQKETKLEETGHIYEDIKDATGVDGVLATSNVAYEAAGTDVP